MSTKKKTIGDRVEKAATKKTAKAGKTGKGKAPKATAPTDKGPKATKPGKATPPKANRMSGLDAAAKVLQDTGKPMHVGELVTAMATAGLWSSKAPTPGSTIYAAITTEIKKKGDESRFVKVERGLFKFNDVNA